MQFKFLCAAATGALALAASGAAQAASIVGLFNTGVDNAGVSVVGPSIEQHWTLDGGTAYIGGQNGVFPLNGPWLAEDATSRWIGPTVTAGESTDPRNDGFYEYNLSFVLTAAEAAGASFTGRFAADNAVSWIRLNNTNLVGSQSGGFSSWSGFAATSPAFQAGVNNLTVRVINFSQDGGNPSGLRVEFTGSDVGTAVPEPATWALMIVGFGGAGAMLRRRRPAVA
ncbi:MAG: PEP-CTERM sorting domain-containing protein [Phenylobacterium sp.]|uniref:PEPxxWA-CTERM sorting domain-containing protein n=1 Tax=Phenylobacterium sp. TaxID=1871053 RepID=UPI001A502143|nr:PEPxxWA-CTERM sorting domain-containing protein [Phenylobacterium sp.]MBL8556171.1 PEP-CTERM sorting domain-containing protein [Phenylobacterium sp.]